VLNNSPVIQLPNGGDITIDFTSGQIPKITGAIGGLNDSFEIYYRIYVSDVMEQTVNTTAIRNSVNPTLASDWAAFYPYTIESNNLTAGATIFTNRKYYPVDVDSSGHLVRSNGGGAFTPKPDNRLFQMSADLISAENLTDNINRDVQNKTGMTGGERYAYASMYIIMRELDPISLTPFYGAPAFINVFLLPDEVSGLAPAPASLEGIWIKTAEITETQIILYQVRGQLDDSNNLIVLETARFNVSDVIDDTVYFGSAGGNSLLVSKQSDDISMGTGEGRFTLKKKTI
jgi:hypothetical protein